MQCYFPMPINVLKKITKLKTSKIENNRRLIEKMFKICCRLFVSLIFFEKIYEITSENEENFNFFENYLFRSLNQFSVHAFSIFGDPIPLKDMPVNADFGYFGFLKGFWKNLSLKGYSNMKYNASNMDFVANKIDFTAKFPYYALEGNLDMKGYFLRYFRWDQGFEYNCKFHGFTSKSFDGSGQISIDQIEVDLVPEITWWMIILGFLFGSYMTLVTSYTAIFVWKKFRFRRSPKIKSINKLPDKPTPKITMNNQENQQNEVPEHSGIKIPKIDGFRQVFLVSAAFRTSTNINHDI